jgi:hypothetical protein
MACGDLSFKTRNNLRLNINNQRMPQNLVSEVKTFFRFCPSCGKRFHIKLVGKELVDSKRETFNQKEFVRGGNTNPMTYGYRGGMGPLVVEEDIPVTVDIEDFRYSYKCKHCGHEWTETHAIQMKE